MSGTAIAVIGTIIALVLVFNVGVIVGLIAAAVTGIGAAIAEGNT